MQFQIERGVRIYNLFPLNKIVNEWQNLMEVLTKEWKRDDIPWWYNERAWVGVVAGAAWRTGAQAFEEYSDTKIVYCKKRKPRKKSGRVDLWLGVGTKEYLIEAKHVEVNADGTKRLTKIKASLAAARSAVSCVCAYSNQKRLSMVCITPYLLAEKKGQVDALLRKLIQETSSERATVAWVFPKNIRTYPWEDGYIYPGGILILKPLRI